MRITALLARRVLFWCSRIVVARIHLTARTTRMRVTARPGTIFRGRATAGEIIAQTERVLDDLPAVSQRAR